MPNSTTYVIEDGEIFSNWEHCNCGNYAEMTCICEGTYDTRDNLDADDWAIRHYKVLRCPACEQLTVLCYATGGWTHELIEPENRSINSNISEYGGKTYFKYKREVLYAPAKPRHYAIPAQITDVINQAETVLPLSPRAAFILCRAVLEEICDVETIPRNTTDKKGKVHPIFLNSRLKMLFEQNNLPNELQEIIDGLKELGNLLAHSSQLAISEKISSVEADTMLQLTDYVIERLYVDKARAESAKDRLASLKKRALGTKDVENGDMPF